MHLRASTGDATWTRWQRRAFTFPVVILAALGVTALFPVLLAAALVGDVLRPHRMVLTRTVAFFAYFLWAEVVGLGGAFVAWLVGRVQGPEAFVQANRSLQVRWNRALFEGGCRIFGMTLVVEGQDVVDAPGPLLVLTRHVSTVDTVLPVTLLSRAGRDSFRFVLKRELLNDPCLDVVGNRLPNHFVRRGADDNVEEIAGVKALMRDLGSRDSVVVFPEGGRFSPSRRARLLERLEKSGRNASLQLARELLHTLPPLTEGTLAMMDANPGADLLLLSHTGLEGAAGFPDFIRGGLVGTTIHVKVWRIPFAQVPDGREARAALLGDAWKKVDAFIAGHHAH
jgi:1-acyl-sn-glycerol-3-phosphate acyltransferase